MEQKTIGQLILTNVAKKMEPAVLSAEQFAILSDFCDFCDSTGLDLLDLQVFLNARNIDIYEINLKIDVEKTKAKQI